MAVKNVTQSAANAAKDSLVYELARIVNDLQAELVALGAKLDADTGVGDVDYNTVIGQADTIEFHETGAPS